MKILKNLSKNSFEINSLDEFSCSTIGSTGLRKEQKNAPNAKY
jgi:hypothetical protein